MTSPFTKADCLNFAMKNAIRARELMDKAIYWAVEENDRHMGAFMLKHHAHALDSQQYWLKEAFNRKE